MKYVINWHGKTIAQHNHHCFFGCQIKKGEALYGGVLVIDLEYGSTSRFVGSCIEHGEPEASHGKFSL